MHALDRFDRVATAEVADVLTWEGNNLELNIDPAFFRDALGIAEEVAIQATEPNKPVLFVAPGRRVLARSKV